MVVDAATAMQGGHPGERRCSLDLRADRRVASTTSIYVIGAETAAKVEWELIASASPDAQGTGEH